MSVTVRVEGDTTAVSILVSTSTTVSIGVSLLATISNGTEGKGGAVTKVDVVVVKAGSGDGARVVVVWW